MSPRRPGIDPPNEFPTGRPTVIADLALEVVTPMFGGGATPGYSDDDWPIRPLAIRGQLRFWWRACNARRFESIDAMRAEENRIWGSSRNESKPDSGPGLIDLRVAITNRGKVDAQVNGPNVAIFPFKETGGDNALPNRPGRSGIKFTLYLSTTNRIPAEISDAKAAAEQALWAWILFGGIGARTRRGCGSLRCTGNGAGGALLDAGAFQPPAQETTTWLTQHATNLVEIDSTITWPDSLKLVPVLSGSALIAGAARTGATTAWERAVDPLRDFRQTSDIGRNVGLGPNHPGQSRWPEPGAIRGISHRPRGGADPAHAPYAHVPTANGSYFPRADLGGLPTVFQMERDPGGHNAFTATLELDADGRSRMASPLIVKPLALENGQFVPLTLLLTAPHLWDPLVPGLKLKEASRALTAQPMNANPAIWPHANKPPFVDGKASARDAYLDFIDDPANPKRITL